MGTGMVGEVVEDTFHALQGAKMLHLPPPLTHLTLSKKDRMAWEGSERVEDSLQGSNLHFKFHIMMQNKDWPRARQIVFI